jgi:hypothetical protein
LDLDDMDVKFGNQVPKKSETKQLALFPKQMHPMFLSQCYHTFAFLEAEILPTV